MLSGSTNQTILPCIQMSKMLVYLTNKLEISTGILLGAKVPFLNVYG
jgi:hypothetical protein